MKGNTRKLIQTMDEDLRILEEALARWGMPRCAWCLMDGHALKLSGIELAMRGVWRDHMTVYVDEHHLPWRTSELEETVPPPGTSELEEIIGWARQGLSFHLVPASRYLKKDFETMPYTLSNGRIVRLATLCGLLTVWSWRALELTSRLADFYPDVPELCHTRIKRLDQLYAIAPTGLRPGMQSLREGYLNLMAQRVDASEADFSKALSICEVLKQRNKTAGTPAAFRKRPE